MIIRQKMIYRADLKANPHLLYVFGDNLERVGMGGQAGAMRGEPNAFGIVTKRSPGGPDEFFGEDDIHHIATDLARLIPLLSQYKALVVPFDGLGSGLARLDETAPVAFAYLNNFLLNVGN